MYQSKFDDHYRPKQISAIGKSKERKAKAVAAVLFEKAGAAKLRAREACEEAG